MYAIRISKHFYKKKYVITEDENGTNYLESIFNHFT